MRLSARSYPHPVLGNRDDVPGVAFQATLEMTSDKQSIYIGADVACSCNILTSMLSAGDVSLVLHVECSNTLFRRAYEFRESSYRISIPADSLNDAVEVNVFMRAVKRIAYRNPEAHPDYGDAVFDVRRGDILAVAEGQVFHIESSFDSLSRIGSIMQISESPKEGDIPMEPYFEGDKIVIFLSKGDFADYKLLKLQESVAGPLTTTIVLPVLVEALHLLMDESTDGIDETLRWVRALTRRMESLGLGKERQALVLAQKILELPIKRALSSSRMLAEA
jgi:hypothetical protein